jgi:cellulose synthase/poly-beta-1,6-N-acetylglucosamine synthase-like glycosyltransferase
MLKRLSGETPKIAGMALAQASLVLLIPQQADTPGGSGAGMGGAFEVWANGLWPDQLPAQVLLLLLLVAFAVQAWIYVRVFAPLAKAMRKAPYWIPPEARASAESPRDAPVPMPANPPAALTSAQPSASFLPIELPVSDPGLISVVICARNEAENLRAHLPLWLDQQGLEPLGLDYELIVVDDGSEDASPQILAEAAQAHPRLRVLRLEPEAKSLPGKKGPLDLGLRAARGAWALLSDADCRPASPARPSACHGGLLNGWVRFETFHTALQYLSWALHGMPYMGVGRNLAYRRSLWAAQGGFAAHAHWPSGDDDLTVNRMAEPGRVAAVWDPEAWTFSQAPETWPEWYRQRFRHFSTGASYRARHRFWLGIYAMSHFGAFAFIFLGWATGWINPWWSMLLVLRWGIQMAVFKPLMKRLHCLDLWHFSTILDVAALVGYGTFVRVVLSPMKTAWR